MDRRTVALGIVAIGAVIAAVVVTVTNHGNSSPKHDAASKYIKSVDAIQQQMRVQITKADAVYRRFAAGKLDASLEPGLARAELTLKRFELQLVVLPAPKIAAPLKALLLQLARAEVALSGEVKSLALFAPTFAALLREASLASKELAVALRAVTPPRAHAVRGTKKQVAEAQRRFRLEAAQAAAKQADAVDAYDAAIAIVERRLGGLRPPAVMQPALATQRRTLAATRRAGGQLAIALRKPNRADVPVISRRFTLAARGAVSVAAQKLQVAAVKAYNARVRAIGAIQGQVQVELLRLQQVAG